MASTDPLAGPRASRPTHAHEAGLEARGPVRFPLEVQDLSTTLFTRRGEMKAVAGLSLAVGAGENGAHADRGADQGTGLHRLHLGDAQAVERARLALDVAHLAADHAAGPGAGGELDDEAGADHRVGRAMLA